VGSLESLIWGPFSLPKLAGFGRRRKGSEPSDTPALSQGHLNLSSHTRVRVTILEWMKVFASSEERLVDIARTHEDRELHKAEPHLQVLHTVTLHAPPCRSLKVNAKEEFLNDRCG